MKNQRTRNVRPTRKLLTCALASCLMLGMAPAVFAQSTGATLRGQVSADSAPATDARVTATNLATGLTRSVQANASGGYSLGGLPPGTYRIDVTAAGQASSQNVTLAIGQTATLNLGVGGVAETAPGEATDLETVTVTAPVMIESRTSEVATYVSQKQIDALPQASRNFLAFADTVPGMIFETGSDGSTKLRGGAQNSNGINVFIDGVGQKNYVLKGGVSGQDSTSGNPFPQLAIGEYKVITSNYKAEYDQISSAAVTAVTKSGTNEFSGSFFWDRTDDGWRKPTFSEEEAGGDKAPTSETQYGGSLGGPIIQDNLFFFVAYEAKEIDRPREVRIGDGNFNPADLTPELASNLGLNAVPFKQDMYFGKLTWQPGDAHLVELSAKVRKEDEITNIGDGPNTPAYGNTKSNDSTRLDLRYQFSSGDWLNDAHLTYEDDYWNPRPITFGPGVVLTNNLANQQNGDVILNLGGSGNFQNKGQEGYSLQDDLTFTGWEGHTLKMGVKYKSVRVDSNQQQPYNPQYRVDYYENLILGFDIPDEFIPYRINFGAPLVDDLNVSSRNKQFGIYIQDDWEVNEHLTLNLGLRYDYEETPGFTDWVTPAGLAAALRGWSNIQNTDYDIEDYISDGNNRKAFKDAWQPRLGFSYDLFADQRHVIFGGAGRSYDRNLFDYLALEQVRNAFPSYQYDVNTPAHPCAVGVGTCVEWDPSLLNPETLYALAAANPNLGAEVNMINNDLKTPYSDQFSLGMRNAMELFGHDWNTSVTLAHIRSYDGIIFSLGNRYPDGSFYGPGRTFGGSPFGQPIPGYGSLIKADNGIETRANQLLVSVDKPYTRSSPWGVTMAYTYTDAEENRSNAANGDEHYVFDYPNLDDHPWVDSIGISKHRFVATGIVDLWGFTFSTKLTLASPPAKNVLNCIEPTPDGLDNCAFGTFEGGYFDDAKFRQWDIAVQKVWDTGTDLKLRVRADVFNVTNEYNYTDFGTFRGVDGVQDANYGRRTGNGTVWSPRMFKLSFGLDW